MQELRAWTCQAEWKNCWWCLSQRIEQRTEKQSLFCARGSLLPTEPLSWWHDFWFRCWQLFASEGLSPPLCQSFSWTACTYHGICLSLNLIKGLTAVMRLDEVLCMIHQLSSFIWELINNTILFLKSRVVYQGHRVDMHVALFLLRRTAHTSAL